MRYTVKEFFTPDPQESGAMVLTISTKRVKDYNKWDRTHMSNEESDVNKDVWIEGSMKLSDCSQNIILDFDAKGDRAVEKRIAKFDKIISELTKMKQNYIAMYAKAKDDWLYAKDNISGGKE